MRPVALMLAILAVSHCACKKGSKSSSQASQSAPVVDQAAIDQLKGTWQVISIDAAGKAVPADRVQKINLQWVFNGENLTIRRPDRPDNTKSFTLDTSGSLKKLTFNDSPPIRAVYSINGNKLQVCVMVDDNPGAGYPAALSSTAAPKTDLLTMERK
jgi:uncharacterized protein (TIGR03067 family)